MPITLFYPGFQPNQSWAVTFTSGQTSATVASDVVSRRDITDPTGKTIDSQLVVVVPALPPGPTSITASGDGNSFTVPSSSFVIIGSPVMVAEQSSEQQLPGYTTAVGADGTLYVAVGGLDKVCAPMTFAAVLDGYPLRFSDGGVLVFNWQGYFIDSLTSASANHFSIQTGDGTRSDRLNYLRHSFHKYCADHAPGGAKQIDPADSNWHLDGTPHVDYSIVIFAIDGQLNGTIPQVPGSVSAQMTMETELSDVASYGFTDWTSETSEEQLSPLL